MAIEFEWVNLGGGAELGVRSLLTNDQAIVGLCVREKVVSRTTGVAAMPLRSWFLPLVTDSRVR